MSKQIRTEVLRARTVTGSKGQAVSKGSSSPRVFVSVKVLTPNSAGEDSVCQYTGITRKHSATSQRLTLGVARHGPLALRNHVLDRLGDLGARLGDVVELSVPSAVSAQCLASKTGRMGRTVSWSNGRASSMFFRVDLRSPSSDSTLVAASLAEATCTIIPCQFLSLRRVPQAVTAQRRRRAPLRPRPRVGRRGDAQPWPRRQRWP